MKLKNILLFILITSSLIACQPEDDDIATPATDITGIWTCSEASKEFGNTTYKVTVEKVSDSEMKFINFYNLGTQHSAKVTVSGSSLTIPRQDISDQEISGDGTINGKTSLSFDYIADDGSGTIDTVTATYSK